MVEFGNGANLLLLELGDDVVWTEAQFPSQSAGLDLLDEQALGIGGYADLLGLLGILRCRLIAFDQKLHLREGDAGQGNFARRLF